MSCRFGRKRSKAHRQIIRDFFLSATTRLPLQYRQWMCGRVTARFGSNNDRDDNKKTDLCHPQRTCTHKAQHKIAQFKVVILSPEDCSACRCTAQKCQFFHFLYNALLDITAYSSRTVQYFTLNSRCHILQ